MHPPHCTQCPQATIVNPSKKKPSIIKKPIVVTKEKLRRTSLEIPSVIKQPEISKAQLSKILSVSSGNKCIVLEPTIIRPLERICGVQWLKGNGVEKIFKLDTSTPNFGSSPVFFMIFSNITTFTKVVNQIRSLLDQEHPVLNRFHIIVVPNCLYQFQEELEQLGLIDNVIKLHSFQWLPLHLDTGILSLELPTVYKGLFVQHDYSVLPAISKPLWQLFFVVGKPRFIVALGQYANTTLKQLDILSDDKGASDKLDSDFGALFIMDRNIDYPSALLTPGTYSALVNEVYGVDCGVCEYKDEELEERLNPVVKKLPVKFNLDSTQDTVYADIKNRYFTAVTSVLSTLTKELGSETVKAKEMALDEIKRYVQTQLQATKSRKKFISNHLLAAETIINVLGSRYEQHTEIESNILKDSGKSSNFSYLEEALVTHDDKSTALRLFCLLCITQKLTDSEVKSFWRKFLHQFGFKYSFTFRNLINANFVSEPGFGVGVASKIRLPKFTVKEFFVIANKFKQVPANPKKINLKFPTCASYVFGGSYIPLVVQIGSMLLNATPIEEIRGKLEGVGAFTVRNDRGFPLQTRSLLIYVVGGVTYAEIAACNLLETLTGARIVLMSDRVVTGRDLMEAMTS